jgi:P4 family phage/plasmid primase-like protien
MDTENKKVWNKLKKFYFKRANEPNKIIHFTGLSKPYLGCFHIPDGKINKFIKIIKDNKIAVSEVFNGLHKLVIDWDAGIEMDEDIMMRAINYSSLIWDIVEVSIILLKKENGSIGRVFFNNIILDKSKWYYKEIVNLFFSEIRKEYEKISGIKLNKEIDMGITSIRPPFVTKKNENDRENIYYPEDCPIDIEIDIEYFKDYLVGNWNNNLKETKIHDNVMSILNINREVNINDESNENNEKNQYIIKGEVEELVMALDINRSIDYHEWIEVCWCLYNIGGEKYRNLFHKFSKKDNSNHYDRNKCNDVYQSENNSITISSLYYWCKNDNEDEFNRIRKKYIKKRKEEKEKKEKELKKELVIIQGNHYPGQKLEVKSTDYINENEKIMYLSSTICPFIGEKHKNDAYQYLKISNGKIYMRCSDYRCNDKEHPADGVTIAENIINVLMDVNITNITNNYNANENENNIDEERGNIDEDKELIKIYDNEKLNDMIINSLKKNKFTDYRVGKILYEKYKNQLIFIHLNNGKAWYIYKKHKWVLMDTELDHLISDKLSLDFKKLEDEYIKNNNIKDKEKKICIIGNIRRQLESNGSVKSIIERTEKIFNVKNKEIGDIMNEKKNLLCFENGVYDLDSDEFRNGKPEDYISMSTGYDFKENYSEYKENVVQFINDILPNEENRVYVLKYLASCLSGKNKDELFHVFTGKTRNGKSKLRDLIALTLGEYFTDIDSLLLTTKNNNSSGPRPELMGLKGYRMIIGSEPQGNDKINTGFMKGITGNDVIKGRGLFEKTEYSFKPQFKLTLLCNDIPKMDKQDDGVWSRCRCIEFPVTFVENPEKENEKKIDRNLDEKMKLWRNDFILLLLEYYKKYKEEGLKITDEIKKFTNTYKVEQNIISLFISEKIERCEKKKIHLSNLYDEFEDWFNDEGFNSNLICKRDFNNKIKKIYNIERIQIKGQRADGIKNIRIIET